MAKGEKTDGCWLWTGATASYGYGKMMLDGETVRAHRAAYLLLVGPIPDGLYVLHRCDVRRCVNPAHLFLGTPSDNTKDMLAKGRGRWQ